MSQRRKLSRFFIVTALAAWPMTACDDAETDTNIGIGGAMGSGGITGTPPVGGRPSLPTGGGQVVEGGTMTGGNAMGGSAMGGSAMGGTMSEMGGAATGGAPTGGTMGQGGNSGGEMNTGGNGGSAMGMGGDGGGGPPVGNGGFVDQMGGQPDVGGAPDMGGEAGMGGAPPPAMAMEGNLYFRERIETGAARDFADPEGGGEFKRFDRVPMMRVPGSVAGDCHLVLANEANDPGQFVRLDAGNVSFSGTENSVMEYDAVAEGYSLNTNDLFDLWDGEAGVVSIDVAGSDRVGALNTGEIASPINLADVAPAADGALSRGGDTITWTPGNGDDIEVEIRSGGVNERIVCISDDDGSVEVPAEAFAWLPAAAERLTVNLSRRIYFEGVTAEPETNVRIRLERLSYSRPVSLME